MKFYVAYLLIFVALINNAQNLNVHLLKVDKECNLGNASISIDSGLQPITILWSNGSIMNNVDQLDEGDYSVKITDGLGQDTTINFIIKKILCEPIISNNFTPNNDGYNDTWSISKIETFPDFDLYVYNRWGQLVHHQSNEYIPWDGKSLTLPLADATYYYILYLSKSDKHKFVKGDVSIIR